MATDPRFVSATPWGANAPRKTFGQVAQRANPQQADAFQNMNRTGLPVAKKPRFSQAVKPGIVPQPQPVTGAPSTQPVIKGAPLTKPLGAPSTQPVIDGGRPRFSDTLAAKPGEGRYTTGGYQPIAEDAKWGGIGYSGPDPREVGTAAAPDVAAQPAQPASALPPELLAVLGGATGQGGKSGGGSAAQLAAAPPTAPTPTAPTPTVPPTTPAAPAAEPNTPPNLAPAGDVGNTGGGTPIVYDDTGAYNPELGDTGGFGGEPFDPNSSIPGVQVVKPNLANPHPNVQKRLDEYVAAGGDPNNFVVIDNSIWPTVLAQYPPEQRNEMKKQMKNQFYADQMAALGTGNPGVQG